MYLLILWVEKNSWKKTGQVLFIIRRAFVYDATCTYIKKNVRQVPHTFIKIFVCFCAENVCICELVILRKTSFKWKVSRTFLEMRDYPNPHEGQPSLFLESNKPFIIMFNKEDVVDLFFLFLSLFIQGISNTHTRIEV